MQDVAQITEAVTDLLKDRTIRNAVAEDRELFLSLWSEFARDIRGNGYELIWTDRTERFFGRLFDSYVSRELDGVVLLAGSDGALIWGEIGKEPLFDTTFGRIANGFGTFIRSEFRGIGLSTRMRQMAARQLCEMGFDSVVGAARHENAAGYGSSLAFGFEEHSVTGVLRLRKG